MKLSLVVDSTADMTEQVRRRLTVVPLTVSFGERSYQQGVELTNREFYEKLVESDVLPQTSQATPYAFEQVFRRAVEAGETVVALTLSQKLSGTYQSAVVAAAEFPGRVFVVDGGSVSIGTGVLAQYALERIDQGCDARQLCRELTQQRQRLRVLAMLDTLEYLKKGGRISSAVAIAGELLSIKPVVCIEDGQIRILGKARGSRQANNLLVRQIGSSGGVDFQKPLLLGYTGLTDVLLQKYIRDSASLWEDRLQELPQTDIGSVVGTHAGPGAVAVAFFGRDTQ